ncbi:hypothetical protein N0V88_003071 [Collariella sp. IMI 366227]|nr:hypothetical protein N0V88_003071 [Collariella sp. IMI 366227]
MTARPSTSSGPGTSKSSGLRPKLDKRRSKDDLALMGMTREGGLQPQSAGIKGQLTPEPRLSPFFKGLSRLSTIHFAEASDTIFTPSQLLSVTITFTRAPNPEDQDPEEKAIWIYHGAIKTAPSNQSFAPARSNTITGRKAPKHRPIIIRAYTSESTAQERPVQEPPVQKPPVQGPVQEPLVWQPLIQEPPIQEPPIQEPPIQEPPIQEPSIQELPVQKPPVEKPSVQGPPVQEPPVPLEDVQPGVAEPAPSLPTSGYGLLDIDIPDIRMERYSVMFSGLLSPNKTKPSLLERRQATTLQRLKTISDRIEREEEGKKRQRSATSPQPMNHVIDNLPGPSTRTHPVEHIACLPPVATEGNI